jgi:hypothetical protein
MEPLEQMCNQMEEDNKFLHPNICKYCIDLIKSNMQLTEKFNSRYVLRFNQIEDPIINNLYKYYESINPKMFLNTLQLIYWPVGEFHDWHDDTIYYDYTTITYLNDDYEGGRTIVEDVMVEPSVGKQVRFPAKTRHMVTKLTKGHRYVIIAWFNKDKKIF